MTDRFRDFYQRQDAKLPVAFPVVSRQVQETCPHCRKGRHSADDCWILHPEKRPTKFAAANPKLKETQHHQSQLKCSFCYRFGHDKENCRTRQRTEANVILNNPTLAGPTAAREVTTTQLTATNPHQVGSWPEVYSLFSMLHCWRPRKRIKSRKSQEDSSSTMRPRHTSATRDRCSTLFGTLRLQFKFMASAQTPSR